jgi:hypothetical protein
MKCVLQEKSYAQATENQMTGERIQQKTIQMHKFGMCRLRQVEPYRNR